MDIDLILNPTVESFGALQSDLNSEVNALANEVKVVSVRTERAPPPDGTLVLDEIFRFIVHHKDDIKGGAEAGGAVLIFLKALIETARAVVERHRPAGSPKEKREKKDPAVIVVVNGQKLELPGSSEKEKAFLKAIVTPPSSPKTKGPKKPKAKQ